MYFNKVQNAQNDQFFSLIIFVPISNIPCNSHASLLVDCINGLFGKCHFDKFIFGVRQQSFGQADVLFFKIF